MKPVVLISRTTAGDAFKYSHYKGTEKTAEFAFPPVAIGVTLPALNADDVESLRVNPQAFAA